MKNQNIYTYSDMDYTFDANYLIIAICLIFFVIPTLCCFLYAIARAKNSKIKDQNLYKLNNDLPNLDGEKKVFSKA